MPYIGLAVKEGTRWYTERQRDLEQDRRMKAEAATWNAQNAANAAAAKATQTEVETASNLRTTLEQNKDLILAGDPRGIATVLNSQLGKTNNYKWVPTEDSDTVALVDVKKGNVVETRPVPKGNEAILAFRALGQTTTEQLNTSLALATEQRKNQFELEKQRQGKQWDYTTKEMESKYDLRGTQETASATRAAASMAANASMYGADKRAQADVLGSFYSNLDAVQRYQTQAAYEKATGRPTYYNPTQGVVVDMTTGQPVAITDPLINQGMTQSLADIRTTSGNNPYQALPYNVSTGLGLGQLEANAAAMGNVDFMSMVPDLSLNPTLNLNPNVTGMPNNLYVSPWAVNQDRVGRMQQEARARAENEALARAAAFGTYSSRDANSGAVTLPNLPR